MLVCCQHHIASTDEAAMYLSLYPQAMCKVLESCTSIPDSRLPLSRPHPKVGTPHDSLHGTPSAVGHGVSGHAGAPGNREHASVSRIRGIHMSTTMSIDVMQGMIRR